MPGLSAKPHSAPLPGGLPDRSRKLDATWTPAGLVSTMRPSPPLTVSTSLPGAMARPSGALSFPPAATSVPVPAVAAEADPGGTDHERSRIGPLSETRPDPGDAFDGRWLAAPEPEVEPQHRAAVDDLALRRHRSVEHVGDEQRGGPANANRSRVPRSVNAMALEDLPDCSPAVEDEDAPRRGRG